MGQAGDPVTAGPFTWRPRPWHRPDPAAAIEARSWTDPCPVCGEQVTEVYAVAQTVTDNPEAVMSIPDPVCRHGDDPDADCTCTTLINPAPNPMLDWVHIVGVVYTLRPCGHATTGKVRFYEQTRPEAGTLGDLMTEWAKEAS